MTTSTSTSTSTSIDKSMADLTRQHNELEKLINDFELLRVEVQSLESKAKHSSAFSEKLMQVHKVLENQVGPNGEVVKAAFSDIKKQSLKLQQDFEFSNEGRESSSNDKGNKKCKLSQLV
ncbi:hypothetical protein L4C34_03005 [Vibrio profundum]|uniref:hypothetical protein n=1 Tax=Vibrio profundum TaxID=2910247 RepID=UPI003D138CF5